MFPRRTIHHRSLWSVESLSSSELLDVLDTARRLKAAAPDGRAGVSLRGRNLALLDDLPPSEAVGNLRSAALGLGAQVSHLRPSDARISAQAIDMATARMLGRLYDAIDCEAMPPARVADVAREAGVPVFNGLGGRQHPTRVLAELLAMQDHCGKSLDRLSVCFVGDPCSPCGDALLRIAATTGFELRVAAPRERWPPPELWERLKAGAVARGERLRLYESAAQAGGDSDVMVDGAGDPPWPLAGANIATAQRNGYREATLQAMLVAAVS
jgi:ornithine carbamoyltransferase